MMVTFDPNSVNLWSDDVRGELTEGIATALPSIVSMDSDLTADDDQNAIVSHLQMFIPKEAKAGK